MSEKRLTRADYDGLKRLYDTMIAECESKFAEGHSRLGYYGDVHWHCLVKSISLEGRWEGQEPLEDKFGLTWGIAP